MAIGSTPVTAGSRVPPWPTLRMPSRRLIRATQAWDVSPAGLSMTAKPMGKVAKAGDNKCDDEHGGAGVFDEYDGMQMTIMMMTMMMVVVMMMTDDHDGDDDDDDDDDGDDDDDVYFVLSIC